MLKEKMEKPIIPLPKIKLVKKVIKPEKLVKRILEEI